MKHSIIVIVIISVFHAMMKSYFKHQENIQICNDFRLLSTLTARSILPVVFAEENSYTVSHLQIVQELDVIETNII